MDVAASSGTEAAKHAGTCATIHCAAFTPSGARCWSEAEFADLLSRDTALLLTTQGGFLLADVIGNEAEIITVAVHPDERRCGVGHALLSRLFAECACRGVKRCILEVAIDNHAALALYNTFAFKEIGIRANYLTQGDAFVSASVMERVFEAR